MSGSFFKVGGDFFGRILGFEGLQFCFDDLFFDLF